MSVCVLPVNFATWLVITRPDADPEQNNTSYRDDGCIV